MFKTMTKSLNDPKQKLPRPEEIDKIPSYIFCRWLSGNMYAIHAANQINIYSDIPIQNQFNLVNFAFGGKIKYIPYPKGVKKDESKIKEIIAKHFKINENLANEYLSFIDKKELENILQMYE